MPGRNRFAVCSALLPVLCLVFAGCPVDSGDMGLPEPAPTPDSQGEQGSPGEQGPPGPQGAQGPPGVSPFELVGGDAVYTQGNVGIGTTTPAEALHVVGNARVEGTIFADAFSSNSPLELQTGGTTRIFVDDVAGHVGLGTSAPEAQLHVQADRAIAILETTNHSSGSMLALRGNAAQKGRVQFQASNGTSEAEISYSSFGVKALGLIVDGGSAILLQGNGSVGINRLALNNTLELEGSASKSVAGTWLSNSDARIKTDVETVTGALDTLDRVRLVRFRYTDAYRAKHPVIEDRTYLNVIAQEFRQVFPDYVRPSGEKLPDGSDILQVDPYPLTVYAAAAIQELHRSVRARGAEITALREQIKLQQQQIDRLFARLVALEASARPTGHFDERGIPGPRRMNRTP